MVTDGNLELQLNILIVKPHALLYERLYKQAYMFSFISMHSLYQF